MRILLTPAGVYALRCAFAALAAAIVPLGSLLRSGTMPTTRGLFLIPTFGAIGLALALTLFWPDYRHRRDRRIVATLHPGARVRKAGFWIGLILFSAFLWLIHRAADAKSPEAWTLFFLLWTFAAEGTLAHWSFGLRRKSEPTP